MEEASKATGTSRWNIGAVCSGKCPKGRPNPRQTAGGYKWEMCND